MYVIYKIDKKNNSSVHRFNRGLRQVVMALMEWAIDVPQVP